MKSLIDWAVYYHKFGFNVTHIVPSKNDPSKKIYKAPTNNRQQITHRCQKLDELQSYDWENATGVGMVLGRNQIRAIDIDHLSKYKLNKEKTLTDLRPIVNKFLKSVNLPIDYPWVVETPTKGFHIIIKTENLPFKVDINPISNYGENKTKAFKPNRDTLKKYPTLGHFEMRWDLHLVLPPSTNKEKIKYCFVNKIPEKSPSIIELNKVLKFIYKYCFDNNLKEKTKGYNLFLDNYHRNHPYIDFSPIHHRDIIQ